MISLKDRLKFQLERIVLRGAHYRLLVIAALIGLVSIAAGAVVFSASDEFSSTGEAIWWAFLRLTDPGYLGDDKGVVLRTISTIVTVFGYVLFMGSLIAIMTQWLSETMGTLESGLTPITQKNHILILGWGNRTPTIVHEILVSEGRVKRFLHRHGARKLRVVILSEEVTTERRYELREQLGPDWNEHQIIFRCGSPLRIEHLRRVDFLNAAAIILPGSDFEWGGSNAADMRTIKTLLSISNRGSQDSDSNLPLMVSEIFDARKIPVAKSVYRGRLEVLASDATISLLIAQNIRHRWLSHVYSELLTHGEDSNEIYVRECAEFNGKALQDLIDTFPGAIALGVLRPEGSGRRPILNPPDRFAIASDDLLVFIARSYKDTELPDGYTPVKLERGARPDVPLIKKSRKILFLGWNDKIPALIHELDSYENETFDIEILSTIPTDQRNARMTRYALGPRHVTLRHLEGDYSAPSELSEIHPEQYDNVVILGCDWLQSKEEADARTILGYLLFRQLLSDTQQKPDILVELLDPQNHELLQTDDDEVLISPMILSHILAHVSLRPGLNAVFHELFSSGGAEIFFRPARHYGFVGNRLAFRDIQKAVVSQGEISIGVRINENGKTLPGGVELNPDRQKTWSFTDEDDIIVLTTYV